MTKNKRAKRDARERKQRNGEPYVVARRESDGKTLREQLLADLTELDLDPAEWTDATDGEIAAAIVEERELLANEYADAMDTGGWSEDDDSGYGTYSYFAHAMAKDDQGRRRLARGNSTGALRAVASDEERAAHAGRRDAGLRPKGLVERRTRPRVGRHPRSPHRPGKRVRGPPLTDEWG